MLRLEQKPYWVSSSFGSISFKDLFSRHSANTFPGKLSWDKHRFSGHFLLSPFVNILMISTVWQCFCASPERQTTWHTWAKQRTAASQYKSSSISSWISSQTSAFLAFSVLTAIKTSAARMISSSSKCTSSVCNCTMLNVFERIKKKTLFVVIGCTPHFWVYHHSFLVDRGKIHFYCEDAVWFARTLRLPELESSLRMKFFQV